MPTQFKLHVRVQCTDWLDVDRIQVFVNGRPSPELNFTRASHPGLFADGVTKFDQAILVQLSEDAHIIVVATGENSTLKTGFGTSDQSVLRPCAYHNPIFVDVDGGGFAPNGDLLGWAMPTGKRGVETIRKKLTDAGLNPLTARR